MSEGVLCDKIQMMVFVFLIALSFATKENKNVAESDGKNTENEIEKCEKEEILVKIEEDEYAKVNIAKNQILSTEHNCRILTNFEKKESSSHYNGVCYYVSKSKWQANRRSKLEKKMVHNGSYDDEEKAAHASDTLARILMVNGEIGHRLNFPEDDTEVFPEVTENSAIFVFTVRLPHLRKKKPPRSTSA